jgi:hypothetical protein
MAAARIVLGIVTSFSSIVSVVCMMHLVLLGLTAELKLANANFCIGG